jgi:hypothetical protein
MTAVPTERRICARRVLPSTLPRCLGGWFEGVDCSYDPATDECEHQWSGAAISRCAYAWGERFVPTWATPHSSASLICEHSRTVEEHGIQ